MLCYRDRTFCASPNCENKCGRKMADFDKLHARNSPFGVAWGFFCDVPPKELIKDDYYKDLLK